MIVAQLSQGEPNPFATARAEADSTDRPACLVRLAAHALNVPMAALLVTNGNRQHPLTLFGLSRDLPTSMHSLVAHTETHPLIIPDTRTDPHFAAFGNLPIRFYAGLPLHDADGEHIGTFFVADILPRSLNADEHTILRDAAGLLLALISARRVATENRRQSELITLMHETALALGSGLDTTELLTTIVRRATMFFGTVRGFLYLREADEPQMRVQVGIGYAPGHLFAPISIGEGLAGMVWQEGRPIAIDDYTTWPKRLPHSAYDSMHAMIGVPLVINDAIIGVLGLTYEDTARRFEAADIETLSRFAQLASIALSNARLFSRMQQSEERYRDVVDSVKEVIFQVDPEGRFTFLNPAWEETLGYSVADSLGSLYMRYIHPDDVVIAISVAQRVLTEQNSDANLDIRLIAKDGQSCWMAVHARTLHNAAGEIIGASGTLVDISNTRRAIQEAVAAQTKIEVLTQADALKNKFMAIVSHELRAPLTSIMGFADLLTLHATAPETVQTYSHNIITAAERIRAMIDEYLDLQRLEASAEKFIFEAVDIVAMLRDATALINTRGHPIILHLPRALYIQADLAKLRRVIENLVGNAIKYSPPDAPIRINLRKHADHIELRVRDRGVGIPPEAQPHIFQSYFRANTDTPGTGLGLAISKEIVERHGGSVGFETEKPGTTFWVRLPRR